jgi:hypothetical protein
LIRHRKIHVKIYILYAFLTVLVLFVTVKPSVAQLRRLDLRYGPVLVVAARLYPTFAGASRELVDLNPLIASRVAKDVRINLAI